MNQVKIGSFLKELRKEKNLTQETLAEQLNVSNRTVSRWETGSNMPDIGMLVEIAEFYDVSIPEIIAGERKSEKMTQETKETAVAMAEYSRKETKKGKMKAVGYLAAAFGVFIIISALIMFPSESSWSSIYAILGSMILLTGAGISLHYILAKRSARILVIIAGALLLFGAFSASDYMAVKHFNQVPRFRYEVAYDSRRPHEVVYKTLFFTAVRENPGTKEERVYIEK